MTISTVAAMLLLLVSALPRHASAESIEGRWKVLKVEDLREDGTVARLPWGEHPIGSIVVEKGSCYIQIMSSDVPAFTGTTPTGDQMKAMQTSNYIAYTGPCTVDEAKGSVKLKVEAAWTANYVGTEQERFFRFENGKMFFGPAPNSMRLGNDRLTRRITLERAK
jgi:hypothetical protein